MAEGTPVDAADDTALIKAVQATEPGAAALLRQAGADIDRKNRAGRSPRDLARSLSDPEIDRALGLEH